MSSLKDVISAMREVLILTEKVDRVGSALKELSQEVREQDRRLTRLETINELRGTGTAKRVK